MTLRSCLMLSWVGLLLLTHAGCAEKESVGKPHTHHPEFEVTLCGKCGEIKESENCCQEGAARCTLCGLHKDSPLCCSTAINGRRDVLLCRKCGEKVFTDKCCKAGIAACPKCGLHKGSPGCCEIEPAPADATAEEVTHAHAGSDHS
jgi:hypothetical protein